MRKVLNIIISWIWDFACINLILVSELMTYWLLIYGSWCGIQCKENYFFGVKWQGSVYLHLHKLGALCKMEKEVDNFVVLSSFCWTPDWHDRPHCWPGVFRNSNSRSQELHYEGVFPWCKWSPNSKWSKGKEVFGWRHCSLKFYNLNFSTSCMKWY